MVRLKPLPSLSFLILSSRLPPAEDSEPFPDSTLSLHHYSVILFTGVSFSTPSLVSLKLSPSFELKMPEMPELEGAQLI